MSLRTKDSKYFITGDTYNCPFCRRGGIIFDIVARGHFNRTLDKKVWYYIIKCGDIECAKRSLHLSKYELDIKKKGLFPGHGGHWEVFEYPASIAKKPLSVELDEAFFHHQPTSKETLDDRIPSEVRVCLSEADSCLNDNHLTGASACLRKAVFKVLKHQQIPTKDEKGWITHKDRVDLLKIKFPDIARLDYLKRIHTLTSQEVHEDDWQDFEASDIRLLVGVLLDILENMYIIPAKKLLKDKQLSELEARTKQNNKPL